MVKKLHLATNLELPLEAITQKFAFLGISGSGKTYGAGKLVEEMADAGAQVVILDPVGVWYGLRLAGSGSGLPIPVFGGERGDLELDVGAGAFFARLIVERGISAVLDVSTFRKGERKRFMEAFAEELFHAKKAARSAMHLVVEEAHVFCPQRPQKGEERMLGAMEDLVRLGRNYGIGVSLLSQRSASVNKDVLTQVECLVAFQTAGVQDRRAIEAWVTEHRTSGRIALRYLSKLKNGEAFFWSPSFLRIFIRIHVAEKRTADTSSTPSVGAKLEHRRELAPVDLDEIRRAMAALTRSAPTNDSKTLQRRIAELEKQLAARPAKVDAPPVEVAVVHDEQIRKLSAMVASVTAAAEAFTADANALRAALARVRPAIPPTTAPAANGRVRAPSSVPAPRAARPLPARAAAAGADEKPKLKRGAREMLIVLARLPTPLTLTQLATLAGLAPGSGTTSDYYGALRRGGYVGGTRNGIFLTGPGQDYVGPQQAVITTAELVGLWSSKLKAGCRRMLDELVAVYPSSFSRLDLGGAAGIEPSSGTFSDYLGILRRNGLVEVAGGMVRASPTLFMGAGDVALQHTQ